MTAGELAAHLESHGMRIRPRGTNGWQAQCPGHDDARSRRALSITLGQDGRQLVYCHSCKSETFDRVRHALNLPARSFFGWQSFNVPEPRNHFRPRNVVIIRGSLTIVVQGLMREEEKGTLQPRPVKLDSPPKARRTMRLVVADLEHLFGLADAAEVGDYPLLYGSAWTAERLGVDRSGVSGVLRSLVAYGALERGKGVPARTGREIRTYKRPSIDINQGSTR